MARLRDVVFDCERPAVLARFWAAALDGHRVAPYDEEELARLHANGIDDPEDDPTVLVESDGTGPRFWFQRVAESKVVKNRVHIDLVCDDVARETARLVERGAVVTRPAVPGHEQEHVVFQDPEGNEFCLFP